MPPTQMPRCFEAASLSRMRSPVTLALELGEGQQHVEGQPAHARCGVERLGHGHERHPVRIEDLDELGEVGERAGEPVDLIDHHHIDEPRADGGQEPLQGGSVERPARSPMLLSMVDRPVWK